MNTVDLSPLKINDTEYGEVAKNTSEKYKCEWDDAVHESYGLYIRQVQEHSRSIHVIRCKAEALVKELEGLNVEEMINKAESLCKESASV